MRAVEAADDDDAMNDTSSAENSEESASGAEGKGAAGAAAPSLDAGVSEADEYKKEYNAFKPNGNAINTGDPTRGAANEFRFRTAGQFSSYSGSTATPPAGGEPLPRIIPSRNEWRNDTPRGRKTNYCDNPCSDGMGRRNKTENMKKWKKQPQQGHDGQELQQ
ncbi:hypothetical protein TcCL_Unassigned01484 [Trypanosoma cruzi]|nr:hypothetical protein TcCL_Unassigned01484 [Trypanosoma cruzi]